MKKRKFKLNLVENIQGYIFILPWILGFIVFTAGPIIFSLIASFTNYNATTKMDFVALDNYVQLFTRDELFRTALWNTIYYVIFSVPLNIFFSFFLAVLLNVDVPGIRIFRTLYYIPAVLSGVAVSLLWMQLLSPSTGLVNTVLKIFGINGPSWLFDPRWTKPALILMSVWSVGGNMLLYLSSLRSIPEQLYESALIDGANWWQRLYKVTIPMVTPVIFFNLITSFIGAFQIFQSAYIITESGGGGPMNSLLFYNLQLWNKAFKSYEMGYASAMAWILFVIVMILTLINLKVSRRWVHYEGNDGND